MIDHEKFKQNFYYLDKEVIVEIIDIFLSEFEDRFNTIQKNIADRDFNGLKFSAHSLKGVISNFMDPVTIELSRKLNEMAKDEQSAGLTDLFENLKRESESLARELREMRAGFIS